MTPDILEPIPVDQREKVRSAVAQAFGRNAVNLERIVGGASALAFRLDANGSSYLLRIDVAKDPLRNPLRNYPCMQAAAEAGIAPAIHYVDAANGIVIMDFVQQQPVSAHPGGHVGFVREIGALIAQLQQIASFPAFFNYPALVGRMLDAVRRSSLLRPELLDEYVEALAAIRAAYPWGSVELVASHNDPNPRNILYDGSRVWLIDWETAFRNDPLVDLAIVTIELASTPDLEAALIAAWLGREADEPVRARVVLLRQLARLYYACLLLSLTAGLKRDASETTLTAMDVAEFRRAVAEQRLRVGTPELAFELAKMMLSGFMVEHQTARVSRALEVVRSG